MVVVSLKKSCCYLGLRVKFPVLYLKPVNKPITHVWAKRKGLQ